VVKPQNTNDHYTATIRKVKEGSKEDDGGEERKMKEGKDGVREGGGGGER
jgi:hypothetical protein